MESIAILGAGGHAKVVAQTIRRLSAWQLVGAIDEIDPGRAGTPFEGVTVLGGREILEPLFGGDESDRPRLRGQRGAFATVRGTACAGV